jgi:hypothetical protein
VGAGETRPVKVAGVGGVPAERPRSSSTCREPKTDAVSFLTIWPAAVADRSCRASTGRPARSSNQVTAKVGQDGNVDVFNNAGLTNVIVDVAGCYDAAADGFTALRRASSTHGPAARRPVPARRHGPARSTPVQVAGVGGVPADADAVVLHVTVTDTDTVSHLTIWPGTGPQPIASNLNWATGTTIASAVTAKVGPGAVSVLAFRSVTPT